MTSLSNSVINIRQIGLETQYSYNLEKWTTISAWPITIEFDGACINFLTDIEFSINYQHFICGANNIQFGSSSVQTNIKILDCINYPGLIQNGSFGNSGFSGIKIFNITVFGEGTTELFWIDLAGEDDDQGGGYICQQWFGLHAANNYVVGCHSTGCIAKGCGGIVGANSQNLTIIKCSSSGIVGYNGVTSGVLGAGGIVGARCSYITLDSCFSTGTVCGNHAGGIVGAYFTHGGLIQNCYSTGDIIGIGAGGIAGYGIDDTIIKSCHSTGIIKGNRSGGIVGAFAGSIEIRNCYTTGNVVGEKQINGAICGSHTAKNNIRVFNCYACGNVENGGYFNTPKLELRLIENCYSEVQNGNAPQWNEVHANEVLKDALHKQIKSYDVVAGNTCVIGLLEHADNNYVLFGRADFAINSCTGVISTNVKTQGDTYKLLIVNLFTKTFEEIQINIEPYVLKEKTVLPKEETLLQAPLAKAPVQASVQAPLAKAPVQASVQAPLAKALPLSMSFMHYNSPSTYIPVGISVLPEGKPVNPMGGQNLLAKVYRT